MKESIISIFNKPIAHRGLWNENIQENSVSAYKNALLNDYPIEIDLFSSKDGVLYSIHDDNLNRLIGIDKNITDLRKDEIEKLRLKNSNEKIPTFREVLKLVNGKVPLLIEIKNQKRKDIVEAVLNELKSYHGKYALQSFNPLYVKKVKKLAPDINRGVLLTRQNEDYLNQKFLTKLILKSTVLNIFAKPDFMSVNHLDFPYKTKLPLLSWTIDSKKALKNIDGKVDNIIFEKITPEFNKR